MIDLFIVSGSIALGLISAIFVTKYTINKKNNNLSALGNVKHEISNIDFEKSVALEALGRINQFFEDKKIDEFERDRLSRKYNNLLDDYDKRVFHLSPILEAQEILEYKKELNSIVSEYTKKIDLRLKNLTGSSPSFGTESAVSAATHYEMTKSNGKESSAVSDRLSSSFSFSLNRTKPNNKVSTPIFSRLPSLKLNPKKDKRAYLEDDSSRQIDKLTQSKYDKNTIKSENENNESSINDKLGPYLSQDSKIWSDPLSHSTTDYTDTTSVNSSDNIPKTLQPTASSSSSSDSLTKDEESNHRLKPEKEGNENNISSIDTRSEIEKIQSDILKTLRRLEDA